MVRVVVGGPFGFAILLPMLVSRESVTACITSHRLIVQDVHTMPLARKNKNTSVTLDCSLIHKSLQKTLDLHCTTRPLASYSNIKQRLAAVHVFALKYSQEYALNRRMVFSFLFRFILFLVKIT